MGAKKNICILACSPRAHGNTDAMAHAFAQGVRSAGGEADILYLREYSTLPCSACYACRDHAHGACILSQHDECTSLYTTLGAAPLIFLAAPIFFYHLPAQLKAFIDRAHASWVQQEKSTATREHNAHKTSLTPVFVGLVAGKARGDKLFEGSMLTLRYFFRALDMHIHTEHCMRGYDAQEDFAADARACEHVRSLGIDAQHLVAKNI